MLEFKKGKEFVCIEDTLIKTKERSEYGLSFSKGCVYSCQEDGFIVGNDQFYDRFNQSVSTLGLCLIDIKYKNFVDKILYYRNNGIKRLGLNISIPFEVIENALRFLGAAVREIFMEEINLIIHDSFDGWTIYFDFYHKNNNRRLVSVEIGLNKIKWETSWGDNKDIPEHVLAEMIWDGFNKDDDFAENGIDCDFLSIPKKLKEELFKL